MPSRSRPSSVLRILRSDWTSLSASFRRSAYGVSGTADGAGADVVAAALGSGLGPRALASASSRSRAATSAVNWTTSGYLSLN